MFHNIWDNPSHWLIFFKIVNITSTSYRLNIHTAAISAVDHIGLTDWPVQEFRATGWSCFESGEHSTMNQQCAKCKTRDLYRGIVPLISSVFFGFREGFFLCCRHSKIPDDQWPCWPGSDWGRRYQSHIFLAYVSGLFFRGFFSPDDGRTFLKKRRSRRLRSRRNPTLQHLVGAIMESPVIVGYFIIVF